MEFKIICNDGELVYVGHEASLEKLGELFKKQTGMPVSGYIPVWFEFVGTKKQAREVLGMPPEIPIPGPMPGPIPIPPKPNIIEDLTDRELWVQTRRTLRRMERKLNYMFEVIKDVDEED